MNICLLNIFCSKLCFSEEKSDLLSLTVSLHVRAFVSVLSVNECLQHRILGFINGTTVRQLLVLPLSWANVTTKLLLQRAQKIEVTWCKVRAVWWIFMTAPSKSLQQGYYLPGCVGSWHQVTYLFDPLNKHLHGRRCPPYVARSYLRGVPFAKPGIRCRRHTFSDNMQQLREPSEWLCGKSMSFFFLIRIVTLNKQLSNKQIFPVCYFLLDPCGYDIYIWISLFNGPWNKSGPSHNPVTLLW